MQKRKSSHDTALMDSSAVNSIYEVMVNTKCSFNQNDGKKRKGWKCDRKLTYFPQEGVSDI